MQGLYLGIILVDLADKIIQSQPSRESRIKQADIVIENNGNLKDQRK